MVIACWRKYPEAGDKICLIHAPAEREGLDVEIRKTRAGLLIHLGWRELVRAIAYARPDDKTVSAAEDFFLGHPHHSENRRSDIDISTEFDWSEAVAIPITQSIRCVIIE